MKFNKNVWFGVALILFALFVIYQSTQLRSLFRPQSGEIGPRAFPIGAAIALIVCAAGKIVTEGRAEAAPLFTGKGWARVAVMFLLLAVYLLAIQYVGYLLATPVFTALFVLAMREGRRIRPLQLVLFSLVTTGILYGVFQHIVQVTLPTGSLFR